MFDVKGKKCVENTFCSLIARNLGIGKCIHIPAQVRARADEVITLHAYDQHTYAVTVCIRRENTFELRVAVEAKTRSQ